MGTFEPSNTEYFEINPKGQIPALHDADHHLMLAKSATNLEYLGDKQISCKQANYLSQCRQRHSDALIGPFNNG
jgi:hypothetical protein